MKKTIGILGGMGPMATADLFRKITALTGAGRDNDHIRIYIDSNASIPDRTAAILEGGEDPVPAMADALRHLELCGADCVIMPCNTAHYFLPRLEPLTKLPFLSMIQAAANACRDRFPGRTVGILATTGTLSAGLYQEALAGRGVPFLVPDEGERARLMEVIYQGVKAGAPPEAYREAFLSVTWRGVLPPGLYGVAPGGPGAGAGPPLRGPHGGAGESRHPLLRLFRAGRVNRIQESGCLAILSDIRFSFTIFS